MTRHHKKARQLLQLSLEVPLTAEERKALKAHLRACPECLAYYRKLEQLHGQLKESLPTRWSGETPDSSFIRDLDQVGAWISQRRKRQRVLTATQSLLGTVGVIAVLGVVIGLFSAIRPNEASEPSSTETSSDIAETENTVTPRPCIALATTDTPIYVEPAEITEILGTLAQGTGVEVTEILNVLETQVHWLSFDYEDRRGWALAGNFSVEGDCPPVTVGQTGVDPTRTNTPTTTPTPTPTQTPTPTFTPTPLPTGSCFVTPLDDQAFIQVHSAPGMSDPIIGRVEFGQYYRVTGQLPIELSNPFVQIDFNGSPGWVRVNNHQFNGIDWVTVSYYEFSGEDCSSIPTLATWPTPKFDPTAALAPGVDYEKVTYIRSTIGSTAQTTGSLPTAAGSTEEIEAVRVNLFEPMDEEPLNGVRMLNVLVQCTGVNSQALRWGYYGSEMNLQCGQSIDTQTTQASNLVVFSLTIPSGETATVQYTIVATIHAP